MSPPLTQALSQCLEAVKIINDDDEKHFTAKFSLKKTQLLILIFRTICPADPVRV